ncbi:MAG: aldehyde dehydrogenase family protein [Candidatus Eremiobacteraeota bacterium]|nr:aldehyde dehydrogenase family protein [Candidatus Eremiobacteraeota bacterium]
MSTQAPAKQPKITYSAVGGNMDEIHAGFEAALAKVKAGLGATHHPYIAGKYVPGEGAPFETRSPIDRTIVVGEFTTASDKQIDAAVQAAKRGQKIWGSMPWQKRLETMRRAAEAIRTHRYELAAVMSIEIGKNRMESLGDAEESADLIDYYADQVEAANGYIRPLGQLSPNERTQDVLRPFGVFVVIAPFNFPLALSTGMSSAALLAGNAVVYKPSVQAPLTGAELAEIYAEAGLPAGVFNLLFGSGEKVGEPLINHPGVDGIAFTGSKDVGMRLMREFSAGGRFPKPVLGELGGKNAAIVTPSADLDMAAEGVMRSAFGLQGQKCSACSRVYVDERVADKFLDLLTAKTKAIAIGDPTKREIYLGPVISEAAAKKYDDAVASARQSGQLLSGGERVAATPLDRGNYVAPVIARLPLDHELFSRELFLPFLAVGITKSFDHSLAEANRSELGLTGGLFSNDEKEIERFFDEMEAGVLYVNRRTGATTGAWPGVNSFSGWKGSGITGKGGCGPYYVAQFMREQSRTRMM